MRAASSRAPPRVCARVVPRARCPPRLARGRASRATTREDVFVDALVDALGAPALERDDDEALDAYVARALVAGANTVVDVARVARVVAECAGLSEATAAVATTKTPTREALASSLFPARSIALAASEKLTASGAHPASSPMSRTSV